MLKDMIFTAVTTMADLRIIRSFCLESFLLWELARPWASGYAGCDGTLRLWLVHTSSAGTKG